MTDSSLAVVTTRAAESTAMIRTILFILLIGAVVFLVGTALRWHMPDLFGKQPQPINFQPLGQKMRQ